MDVTVAVGISEVEVVVRLVTARLVKVAVVERSVQ